MITRTAPSWHTEDWQIQLSNSLTDVSELLATLNLSPQDLPKQLQAHQSFPVRVPRQFVDKMQSGNPFDPLLLQVLPQPRELVVTPGFQTDPLQEQQFTPLPGLIHKYRSRVLLTTSSACAINCRYCFRRHFPYQDNRISQQHVAAIIQYLKQHPEVNEVILSGGDPLATSNSRLKKLLEALEALPQLTRIRVHTRFPVVIPQRIDQGLLEIIEHSRLRWVMVVHSNHSQELGQAFQEVMQQLRDMNVLLLNQSVLLKDINDNVGTLTTLSETLFTMGIQPYYLHLLDPVVGASHFDIPEDSARALYHSLLAALPGYLAPKLVRETPDSPAKTPII
ncbi:MAG: EF-P beta-lysylation protein EpmB [Pseudomonadales bacterium]|nr:EF-P beta-lysylation protein EpmB [Pseudomonadales bacterium]